MPLEKAEAIVLRSFNLNDLDKIVYFFTRDRGLLKGVAKGARKFGNRFGSSLEPMSLVTVFYYEKERKDLVTVTDCELLESFFEMQKEVKVSFILSYFAELVEEFFPSRAKEELLFRLLLATLQALKKGGKLNFLSRYFEAWFLKINGFLPDFSRCKKCGKKIEEMAWISAKKDGVFCNQCADEKKESATPVLSQFIGWVRNNPPLSAGDIPFSEVELETIGKTLQAIIVFHMEKEPKTLHYLKTIGKDGNH